MEIINVNIVIQIWCMRNKIVLIYWVTKKMAGWAYMKILVVKLIKSSILIFMYIYQL